MTVVALAVDCCWFAACDDPSTPFEMIQLLGEMHTEGAYLLLDHEDHIMEEYSRNVPKGVARKFIETRLKCQRIYRYSGSLTKAENGKLDSANFDPADRPYLGVARSHGNAPFLTTEEKHLAPAQAERVRQACGVPVVDTSWVRLNLSH